MKHILWFLTKLAALFKKDRSEIIPVRIVSERMLAARNESLWCQHVRHGASPSRRVFEARGVSASGKEFTVFQCVDKHCCEFVAVVKSETAGEQILFRGQRFTPHYTRRPKLTMRIARVAAGFVLCVSIMAANAASDLVVSGSVGNSPNPVTSGSSFTNTFTIGNSGSGAAAASTTRLQIKNAALTSTIVDQNFSTPAIAAGGSANQVYVVTIPAGTTPGSYNTYITLDRYSTAGQGANTGNDYAQSPTFTVTAPVLKPDLAPNNVQLGATTVLAGGTLNVSFDMPNIGNAAAAATISRLRLNQSSTATSPSDVSLGDVSTPAISAGSTASGLSKLVTIPSSTPAGIYYIWVVADNTSVLNQSNVANDYARSASFTVTVTVLKPDLAPNNVQLGATTVLAGGTLNVSFDMPNIGNAAAAATISRLRLNQSSTATSPSDVSLGDVSTPAISAGSTASGLSKLVTIPSSTPAGIYYIWVVADNTSVLNQSNVANDYAHSASFTVTVTVLKPDLAPNNVQLGATTVLAGGTLNVTFDMPNIGNAAAAATISRLRLNQSSTGTSPSDISLGDVNTPAIAAGGTGSGLNKLVTIPASTPAGTYYIWVVGDNTSVLDQSNVANDYAHSASFTVTAPVLKPDLAPNNVQLGATTVLAGGTLNVTFDMPNIGNAAAAATISRLRLNQSSTGTSPSDISLGDVNTPAIAAGGIASGLNKLVTIPANTPDGTYYIWVVGDNTSVLDQSNVANDYARSASFTVGNQVGGNGTRVFAGKAIWIHFLPDAITAANVESGGTVNDSATLLDFIKARGFKSVIIKAGEGEHLYPASAPLSSAFIGLCHQKNLKVYGYAYIYGTAYDVPWGEFTTVQGEINTANQILATGCDGLVIDWETEFQKITDQNGNPTVNDNGAAAALHAAQYCQGIRTAYPNAFLAHAPIWNPVQNWPVIYQTFNRYCDVVMPQAYCAIGSTATYVANSAGAAMASNMDSAWTQVYALWSSDSIKPIAPVLWAVGRGDPNVTTFTTTAQLSEFVNTLKGLPAPASPSGYQGVSFWAAEFETAALWNGSTGITIGPTTTTPVLTGIGGGGIAPPSNGNFGFQINTETLQQVTIRAGDSPAGPWTDIAIVPITNGIGTFIDHDAGAHPCRFYCVKP